MVELPSIFLVVTLRRKCGEVAGLGETVSSDDIEAGL
jgi:hypothetical protein